MRRLVSCPKPVFLFFESGLVWGSWSTGGSEADKRRTENEPSEQPQAPTRGLPPGAAQRAMRGRGRGMPRR